MPTSKRSRSATRSRGRSGGYQWHPSDLSPASLGGNTQGITGMFTGLDEDVKARATLIRMVGMWGARPSAEDLDTVVQAAIYILSEDAQVAGAVPELELDLLDYMWRDTILLYAGAITGNAQNQFVEHAFDIRSKRKLRSQENIVMFQAETLTAQGVVYSFHLRGLFWVP